MIINPARIARDVVVVAASAGGLRPLQALCASLPPDLPAGLAVVWHRNPFADGEILKVLRAASNLPVVEPGDRQRFDHGAVFLAPRDRHLLLEDGAFHLSRGPKQHFLRPAADLLFTSAALAHGRRVLGVVLSGSGFDGASGAIDVKGRGGMVLTQQPDDAELPYMPQHTLDMDHVDASLPLPRLLEAVVALIRGQAFDTAPRADAPSP